MNRAFTKAIPTEARNPLFHRVNWSLEPAILAISHISRILAPELGLWHLLYPSPNSLVAGARSSDCLALGYWKARCLE
jgi:hypothetical protein